MLLFFCNWFAHKNADFLVVEKGEKYLFWRGENNLRFFLWPDCTSPRRWLFLYQGAIGCLPFLSMYFSCASLRTTSSNASMQSVEVFAWFRR